MNHQLQKQIMDNKIISKQIMDNITIEQMRLVTQMLEYGVNKIVLQNAIKTLIPLINIDLVIKYMVLLE